MTAGPVTTDTVLESVLASFEEWIEPELGDPYARSLAITLRQLVRHARARVEHEPRLLWEDNRELRGLLTLLADRLPDLAAAIDDTLDTSRLAADTYPDVADLRDEADALRRRLSDVIDRLWREENLESHRLVREYLSHHLMREAVWTTEVFVGARR